MRDPLERFQSAFTSTHPLNREFLKERRNGINQKRNRRAYECFPTLEDFALHLGGNDTKNKCTKAAQAAVDGETRIMIHMWGNYQKMVATIPAGATVYVIRTSHLWDDWFRINKLLDPTRAVHLPRSRHERNVRNLTLPVSRNVSQQGRFNLCKALKTEYQVYFELMGRAKNMNATDRREAREKAEQTCPYLLSS